MEIQDFTVNERTFGVEVVRTGNRNAYARVSNGKIIISVPRRIGSREAERVVQGLYARIRKSIERNPYHYMQNGKDGIMDFKEGEAINALGKEFQVRVFDCNARLGSSIIVGNEIRAFVPSYMNGHERKEAVSYLARMSLTKALRNDVAERVNALNSMHFGSRLGKIRITKANSRWGSCSKKRGSDSYSISINFKLLLMEEKLLEYVIVHELAHTMQLNHSKRFWDIVEGALPDYRKRRRALRNAGS